MGDIFLEIFFIVIGVLLVLGIFYFNKMVKQKQNVHEAWSGIDVQLKRRAELLPSLVEVVKGYAKHEKDVLQRVTELRSQSTAEKDDDVGARQGVEEKLSSSIGKLFAVIENYPDLKADKNFRELQNSLVEIEDTLQMARRYYNGTVRDMNILVQSFPSNVIAGMFKFQSAVFFEIENPLEKIAPKLDMGDSA